MVSTNAPSCNTAMTTCRFLVSYIPGGTTGLSFMLKLISGLCTRTVSQAMEA